MPQNAAASPSTSSGGMIDSTWPSRLRRPTAVATVVGAHHRSRAPHHGDAALMPAARSEQPEVHRVAGIDQRQHGVVEPHVEEERVAVDEREDRRAGFDELPGRGVELPHRHAVGHLDRRPLDTPEA